MLFYLFFFLFVLFYAIKSVTVAAHRMEAIHPAWGLLFYNPQFWSSTGKTGFTLLRAACRGFRADIPEHLVIRAVFRGKVCKKVDLFRLFPLSVNDVVRMRSPMDFLAAFDIAIRKVGGFENCMAFVRDCGWRNWCEADSKRRALVERLDTLIRDAGFSGCVDGQNPAYRSAVSNKKRVSRVVVWRYTCTYEGLLPREQFDPWQQAGQEGVILSRRLHANQEFQALLHTLRDAVGFWYKGIHGDVRSVEASIRAVRDQSVWIEGGRNILQHQAISGGMLLLGLVTFQLWV